MMGKFGRRVLALVFGMAVAGLAAPPPAFASDCGAAQLECLVRIGAIGTSDALHETECRAEYVACLKRQILLV